MDTVIDISGQNPMLYIEEKVQRDNTSAFTWGSPEEHCSFLEEKIDVDIGFYYTKKYIATAFWSQISTPINLSLTFITALTTAQANTTGMLPEHLYSSISVAALIISVLNTFFRPHVQMSKNAEFMKECGKIASEFEAVYYGDETTADSIVKYKQIQKKMSDLRDKEGVDTINFMTDFIHLVARNCCFRSKQKWLDMNRIIMEQSRARSHSSRCSNGDCCIPSCSDTRTVDVRAQYSR